MRYERKDKFSKPITPAEVLKLALEKEKSSYEFYKRLIEMEKNACLMPVLEKLRNSEQEHIKIIQNMLNDKE